MNKEQLKHELRIISEMLIGLQDSAEDNNSRADKHINDAENAIHSAIVHLNLEIEREEDVCTKIKQ